MVYLPGESRIFCDCEVKVVDRIAYLSQDEVVAIFNLENIQGIAEFGKSRGEPTNTNSEHVFDCAEYYNAIYKENT